MRGVRVGVVCACCATGPGSPDDETGSATASQSISEPRNETDAGAHVKADDATPVKPGTTRRKAAPQATNAQCAVINDP